MADYRELSQQYAQGAIKAAILLNGGAAVALLSQLSSLITPSLAGAVRLSMLFWALGTALGGATWILGFLSTRFVDKSERETDLQPEHLASSDCYMRAGIFALLASLACFLAGCAYLALTIKIPA